MKKYRTDLIGAPRPADDKFFGDVDTQGIIDTVLYADPKAGTYTKDFAKTLKGITVYDTCRNLWQFIKEQIPYKIDSPGYQWIKSPGRLWSEKAGDCKSFSLFTASVLKNLGITYGYRFVSFDSSDPTPTHVYVYVPSPNGEILIDAVWTGPFNTEKPYTYKKDYPIMAKTHYLGANDNHKPGQLVLSKPIDQYSDQELDLMLIRQELEIKKSQAGIAGIGAGYDESLKAINHCIRNIDNPDYICAIGEALEDGEDLDAALSGIGASAKKKARKEKRAAKKKETGKTAAGRLLQKVGKGLKKAGQAVTKVVTAPARLFAKGAMEIYLPKAAPFFLYLFTPANEKLPDMMQRKKDKAQKFKNFVVKGLGMKDDHFMKIVSNGFLKKFGKTPQQYLADALKNRVSGIGNPKERWRRNVIAGIGSIKNKPSFEPKAKANYNSTYKCSIGDLPVYAPDTSALQARAQAGLDNARATLEAKNAKKAKNRQALTSVATKAASGDLIGAAIQAITWLIGKISSLFKKDKDTDFGTINANDFPDVERDAANAFEYKDLSGDYSGLNTGQQDLTKKVVADAIAMFLPNGTRGVNVTALTATITKYIKSKLPFLNDMQINELTGEVLRGSEAIDQSEGYNLSQNIRESDEPTGWMADTKVLDEVVVTAGPKSQNNSGLMFAGLGLIALLAFSKNKK